MRAPRLVDRHSAGALILALAIPFLFVHERYQPSFELDYGSTSFEIRLSDFAVALVLLAALFSAVRRGSRRLGPGRLLWVPGALLLVWLALETFRPASIDDAQFDEHFVSYLKFVEYALLTLAVPLLIRRARDLTIFFGVLVLWCAVATAGGLAQFFGLDVFDAWEAGRRQPSFLGHHDLAALCAIATGLAAAGIVATRRRIPAASLFVVALVAGTLGMLVAASLAAALGFAVGAVALALASRSRFSPTRNRVLALFALVVVVAGGTTAIRADSLEEFVRFIGIRDEPTEDVETYSQRTVLAYIGLRIFQDNPVIGVGWQRSSREEVFTPYLADARERFPNVAEEAFPAPGREWGVQNLYIQMLADAGLVGFLLLIAVALAGIILAWRTARHAPSPWGAGAGLAAICVLLTLAGEWASLGIVAGIPLDAATCLFLGLAAAGAATTEEETFS